MGTVSGVITLYGVRDSVQKYALNQQGIFYIPSYGYVSWVVIVEEMYPNYIRNREYGAISGILGQRKENSAERGPSMM